MGRWGKMSHGITKICPVLKERHIPSNPQRHVGAVGILTVLGLWTVFTDIVKSRSNRLLLGEINPQGPHNMLFNSTLIKYNQQ